MLTGMAHFPHPHTKSRAPRLCFTAGESISFSVEGKETQGTLQVVSATGGSARILRPLSPGTLAEISLHLSTGPVSALVEFLPPRPQGRFFAQAFRFVAFGDDDYARFHRTLQMLRAGERMARV